MTSFLDKYRYLNGGYQVEGTTNNALINDILSKAGPHNVYHRSSTYRPSTGVSRNVTYVTTEVSHEPAIYNTFHYGINEDSDPVHIVRPITPITLRQNVRVRYLEPPNPPTPAPIIIKERQLTPPPPAPPIRVIMREPSPPTPPPLIIRENPPMAPRVALQPTIIEKIIPPPTPPPRQVILERYPAPDKPRDIIYEKWLPYKAPADRQVILERGKIYQKLPVPKNVIIDYEKPNVNVERIVHNEGIIRAEPNIYTLSQADGELKIVDRIYDLPPHSSYNHLEQARSIPAKVHIGSMPAVRAKSAFGRHSGPYVFNDPWRSTYKNSYTGRGFGI